MNKGKILGSLLFIIAGLVLGVTFLTATNYIQLAVAIFLYPLLILFFFVIFPRKVQVAYHGKPVAIVQAPLVSVRGSGTTEKGGIEVVDIDKRAFLKMVGGAGLALFLFSIFNKRVENLFFKNLPAPSENALETTAGGVIDPTQSQPMYGYTISEIDGSIIAFYGFTNKNGAWFIMREDTVEGSFRYARGIAKFPNNWANRANLNYDYYSKVFKS